MSEHLLDVKNLRTIFSTTGGIVQAVRGIDIHVDPGEFLGIIGESGCGKSVTMLSVMKLLDDNAAVKADEMVFDGTDLTKKTNKQNLKALEGKWLNRNSLKVKKKLKMVTWLTSIL